MELKKRNKIGDSSLIILKDWLEQHKNKPYLTAEDRILLSKKTNMSTAQVSGWLKYQREKIRRTVVDNYSERLSIENRSILKKHYYSVNIAPNLQELNDLEQSTGESLKKIKQWFATERFKNRKSS